MPPGDVAMEPLVYLVLKICQIERAWKFERFASISQTTLCRFEAVD